MSLRSLQIGAFAILFTGWSIALLLPIPEKAVDLIGGQNNAFYLGKTLHLGVYCALTLLIGSIELSRKIRLTVFLVLLAHGWATEYLQQFVQRGSSVRDALIDNGGVLLGVTLGWYHRWRELFRSPEKTIAKDIITTHR